MTVLLIDGVGRERLYEIPDHLHRFRMAVWHPRVVFQNPPPASAPLDVRDVVFEPNGGYRVQLTPTGVAAIPIWRMRQS